MDLIHEGNDIILQVVNLLNEVSPEGCPNSIEFTNFVIKHADRLALDAATIVSLAAELESQLLEHEGTVH